MIIRPWSWSLLTWRRRRVRSPGGWPPLKLGRVPSFELGKSWVVHILICRTLYRFVHIRLWWLLCRKLFAAATDSGWELSSDSTASPVRASYHCLLILQSKTGFSTTASWLLTSQNNTIATAILTFLMSIFFGIVCSVFVLGPLCCLRQCFLLIVYVKCHFTIALCKQN